MAAIAVLGYGTVGSGVVEVIRTNRDSIESKTGQKIDIKYVLDLRDFPNDPVQNIITHNYDDILNDPSVEVVVEVMGGTNPAYTFVKSALQKGKSVCTSNKELVAAHGGELMRIAKENNVNFLYEASVGGGIPIIRTLLDNLQGNNIKSILGIINGTTNYILSKMMNDGITYDDALSQAQMLGYAEKDPTSDVDGFDSTYKLSILSSLAFKTKIPYTKIYREGIRNISLKDINYGLKLGYTLKLLAIGKNTEKGIEVRVHPTFIRNSHPLATVNDSYNAIFVTGDSVEDVMLYGRGAGKFPTGSAVVGDILYAAKHENSIQYSPFENTALEDDKIHFIDNFESAYYMRLLVNDTIGVLAKITSIFSNYNISVAELIQYENQPSGVPLIIVTHVTHEYSVRNAVREINELKEYGYVEAVIRVN